MKPQWPAISEWAARLRRKAPIDTGGTTEGAQLLLVWFLFVRPDACAKPQSSRTSERAARALPKLSAEVPSAASGLSPAVTAASNADCCAIEGLAARYAAADKPPLSAAADDDVWPPPRCKWW